MRKKNLITIILISMCFSVADLTALTFAFLDDQLQLPVGYGPFDYHQIERLMGQAPLTLHPSYTEEELKMRNLWCRDLLKIKSGGMTQVKNTIGSLTEYHELIRGMEKFLLVKPENNRLNFLLAGDIQSSKNQVVSIMFRQSILNSMAAVLPIACTGVTRAVAEKPGCGANIVEFVQITSMQLVAGKQTFEAFRILRSGMVEWARWNSSGHLLDLADPHDAGSEAFDKIVSSPSFLNPPKPSLNDGTRGRPTFRVDMATLSESGIKAVSMTKIPDDIAEIIEVIRRSVKAISVQPGWYIWTQPYPPIGKADIDLADARCDSAIAMVLSEAIATGRLVVRADNSIQAFLSGERANRIAFEARLAKGNLLFGVLFAE